MSKHHKQSGFTIVETLVAIAVLMIAIAGPLTVATKAFTAALDAKNETIASSLAQETLEYVSNWKDTNLSRWPNTMVWPAGTANCTSKTGTVCTVQVTQSAPGYQFGACSLTPSGQYSQCTLWTQGPGYQYTAAGFTPTPFTRYFYVTQTSDFQNELLVTSVVKWNTGSVSNQVQLQELFTNASRNP